MSIVQGRAQMLLSPMIDCSACPSDNFPPVQESMVQRLKQVHSDRMTAVSFAWKLDVQELGAQRDPVPITQRGALGHEVVVHIDQAWPNVPAPLLLYLDPSLQQHLAIHQTRRQHPGNIVVIRVK